MIRVVRDGTTRASNAMMVSKVEPGLFTADASGRGLAAGLAVVVDKDGARRIQFLTTPIAIPAGGIVALALFGTGMRGSGGSTKVSATVKGLTAEVLYAGAQGEFAGLDQVNIQLPAGLSGSGEVDVQLTVDGRNANCGARWRSSESQFQSGSPMTTSGGRRDTCGLFSQLRNIGLAEHLKQRRLCVGPNAMGRTPALARAGVVAGEAEIQPDRPLDGLDHLQDGGGAVQFLQLEPAGIAPMGDHQPGTGKILQYLAQELLGTLGGHGQFRTAYPRARRKSGQVNHHPDGIVCGSGQLHKR